MLSSNSFTDRLLEIQNNMLSFAYTLTSNRDDAYDLLQDTTVKVLESRDKYTENVNFKGWVFTIMRNLFINKYRAVVRSGIVIDRSEELYQLNLSQDSGLDTPEGAIAHHEIMDALRNLKPEIRDPFTMYLEGYRYAEIARKYKLPLGTVKSRIYLARQCLQKELATYRFS